MLQWLLFSPYTCCNPSFFLSPHSAVVAFCEGILQHATAWEALREDLAAQKAAS